MRPVARLDERGHPLAEPLVGHADDERVEDVRVGLERALDLLGEHLLAAGVDARVAAAEQRDRAVLLEPGEVAGHDVAHAVDLDEASSRSSPGPCSSRAGRARRARAGRSRRRSTGRPSSSMTIVFGPADHPRPARGLAAPFGDDADAR